MIDNSSSMEEEIQGLNDPKKLSKELNVFIKESIKKTEIYKKITMSE